MSGANMICPKCKTFQPSAEECTNCGVVVAKLWAQHSDKSDPQSRETAPHSVRSRGVLVAAGLSAVGVALLVIGFMRGGADDASGDHDRRPSVRDYIDAAHEAQRYAEDARERMEAAAFEAETGVRPRNGIDYGQLSRLGVDLDRLASELNAVAEVRTVQLAGSDLRKTFSQCARFTNRYFRTLRYGSQESYPVPSPQTELYTPSGFDGRYRCEGDDGAAYLQSAPRSREGIAACWTRHDPGRRSAGGRRGEKPPALWVQMKWDDEAKRWSIYSRADQRSVDRSRLQGARARFEEDIQRSHGRREERALKRIPELIASVEDARSKLRVAAGESKRSEYSALLQSSERQLKTALVDRRYTRICATAARAALDRREADLQ